MSEGCESAMSLKNQGRSQMTGPQLVNLMTQKGEHEMHG